MHDEPLFSCVWQLWYTGSMKAVCVWLTERLDLQLHTFQLKTLIKMVKVSRSTAPLPVVQCLFRGNISSQTSFHLLLSSDPPSLLLISTFPKPTEDLPWLSAARRPGRNAEEQELWDRLQPANGGGSNSGGEGRRQSAGHQHERQRRGGRVTDESPSSLIQKDYGWCSDMFNSCFCSLLMLSKREFCDTNVRDPETTARGHHDRQKQKDKCWQQTQTPTVACLRVTCGYRETLVLQYFLTVSIISLCRLCVCCHSLL